MNLRNVSVTLIALSFFLAGAAASGPVITLPEMLAIELPAPDLKEIAPTISPIKELLEGASAGGLRVTHDRAVPLPLGGTVVTWTAWEGEPGTSTVRATIRARVYVFPFGHTPVGISSDDHATAGNHSPKIVRDFQGKLHMAWLDAGPRRPGFRVMYRRAAQDAATGRIRWETNPIRVSDPPSEAWNSYLGMEASEKAVHFVWQGRRSIQYRRLVWKDNAWFLDPIRDTRAIGLSGDNGPDMGVRGDNEIHIVTASGKYAVSTDGGSNWILDQVPPSGRGGMKNPALAVDGKGNAHVVFIGTVRSARQWSSSKPNRGYWELRYVRRQAGGGWIDAHNVLADFPLWNDANNDWDVLADWPDVAADQNGNIHVVWHGTVNTHIFGKDEAFYSRRPTGGADEWGKWSEPQSLHPVDRAKGEFFSFAPSLSIDPVYDTALAVVFFDRTPGRHILDFDGRVLRNGILEGPPVGISRLAQTDTANGRLEESLSAWFPTAAPRIFRNPSGRVWLDVLYTAATPERYNSAHFVIYLRHEVTELLRQPKP